METNEIEIKEINRVPDRRNFISINLLRGVSVILIVLYHYTSRYNQKSEIIELGVQTNWSIDVFWGCAAVVTFFMMSGFLIGGYFDKTMINTKAYVVNRFFRLYPTFWCGVIITYIVLINFFSEAAVSLKAFIFNFTMIPYFFGELCVDGAYWTMQVEFFFSLVMGIILLFGGNKIRRYLLFLWMFLTFIFYFIPDNLFIIKGIRFIISPKYSHMFIGGIASYLIFKRKFLYYSIILLCICSINQILYAESNMHTLFFLISIIIFLSVDFIDKYLSNKNIIIKFFSFIASISYSWYLIHQMIGYAIIKGCVESGITSVLVLFLTMIATAIMAYFLHVGVEKPTATIGKRISRKLLIKGE